MIVIWIHFEAWANHDWQKQITRMDNEISVSSQKQIWKWHKRKKNGLLYIVDMICVLLTNSLRLVNSITAQLREVSAIASEKNGTTKKMRGNSPNSQSSIRNIRNSASLLSVQFWKQSNIFTSPLTWKDHFFWKITKTKSILPNKLFCEKVIRVKQNLTMSAF